MDFALTEEQQQIFDVACDFGAREMAPYAHEWDKNKILSVETLTKAAQLGFASIYVKSDVGGSELGRFESTLIFEGLSRGCVSTAAFLSIHNMASWMIDSWGTDAQRQRWLPKLGTFELKASYCLTEPGSGSDAAALKTRAERDGDYYVLNGSKAFISGASVNDIYVVMVRTGGPGPKGISCIVVEKDTPGLSFGAMEEKMGWRTQPTGQVIFDNCRVPAENLLGEEGEGFKIAMAGLDGGRLNIAACSLGGAQSGLDMALNYMKEREQFGKRLADFQALQFRLADMMTHLEASRLMVRSAAWKVDNGAADKTASSAMAKRFATDMCFDIVNQALQLHGGYGYIKEYQVERLVRDLRVHQILEGTNEIMRVIIARDLIG